jgi:molecular chaperone GrpE
MSKKDKEIPSKEDAKSKIANHEIDETLQELAFSESEEEKEEAMKHKKKEKEEPIKTDWTEEELRELVKKAEYADRYMEQLMRIQAEFENHKKRLARDKEEFLKLANEGLIESLLPVFTPNTS